MINSIKNNSKICETYSNLNISPKLFLPRPSPLVQMLLELHLQNVVSLEIKIRLKNKTTKCYYPNI